MGGDLRRLSIAVQIVALPKVRFLAIAFIVDVVIVNVIVIVIVIPAVGVTAEIRDRSVDRCAA
jgi:hypothetical protein